jgi:hypothetical protein
MKSILPTIPWAEEPPFRVFTSHSTNSVPSAPAGNDKRIFRYLFEEGPHSQVSEASPSTPAIQPLNKKRLFCSRFIKISQQ